jgi:GNAT superfamily N-acetyltransferase
VALGYVRPARPDDAGEIARIQLTTWRVAYGKLLPRHVLDQLEPEWLAGRWREAIDAPPSPRHRVLMAVEQAESGSQPTAYPVGFIATGPADEAALAPDEQSLGEGVAAVTDLLVEPRWGRRGHGSRLLAAAVDHLRADGFGRVTAWLPDGDAASSRFYSSAGWEQDGTARTLEAEGGTVREARWHVSLAEPQAEPNEEQA